MGRRPKPADPQHTIGEVIRSACARKQWSQTDLARALGMPRQRVSNICHGRRRPSAEWLDRCAQALGINRAEFGLPAKPDRSAPPAKLLNLVVLEDGLGMPELLGTDDDRSAELLRSLGFNRPVRIDGPDLVALLRRATDAKIALVIRTDLDVFPQ